MEAESSSMATRRSSRQIPKKLTADDQYELDSGSASEAVKVPKAPARKKTKVAPKNARKSTGQVNSDPKAKVVFRRKQGMLGYLPNMPVDVLFEIFSHLNPFDLLKLARMTKDFRRLLMHRSTISVWKSALDNVPGLPPCPPDMNEIQWTNLVFSPHCHFCLRSVVRSVDWKLRTRLCSACAKDELTEYNEYLKSYGPDSTWKTNIQDMIPKRPTKRYRSVYLQRDYDAVQVNYDCLKTDEEKLAYCRERELAVGKIYVHANSCETYSASITEGRGLELQQLKDDRKEAIIEKLTELGWRYDIENMRYPDSLDDHKLIRQPQLLTDRIWARIKGPIIEFMEEMRTKRLARELAALVIERKIHAVEVLRTYKNARLPITELLPEPVDFCNFPAIKAVLEQPANVTVDETSFAKVIPELPTLIEKWRAGTEKQIVKIVKTRDTIARRLAQFTHLRYFSAAMMSSDDEEDFYESDDTPGMTDEEARARMHLATCVFICRSCSYRSIDFFDDYFSMDSDDDEDYSSSTMTPLFFPQVLGHTCMTRGALPFYTWDQDKTDASRRLDGYSKERKAWSGSRLSVDAEASKTAKFVVEKAGLNPETATVSDMDALDLVYLCAQCICPLAEKLGEIEANVDKLEDMYVVPIFGWREIIKHQANIHPDQECAMRPLLPEELAKGQIGEKIKMENDTRRENLLHVWSCAHCRDLPSERDPCSKSVIENHLTNKHNIAEGKINVDYFEEFAAPGKFTPNSASKPVAILEIKTM